MIQYFREQELFGKIKLDTFDISPEVLELDHRRRDGLRHGRPAVPDGLPAGDLPGADGDARHLPINSTYTGPLFVDTPEKAKAILTLAKQGIR